MITAVEKVTAREVAKWIQSLPEEFQDADFEAMTGSMPTHLKRLVAYRCKDDANLIGVCANPMGTHLPFDNSLIWEHVLHQS